jgi:hypothetical protein
MAGKEENRAESTIRVVMFNGKKSDWVAWEAKFLAKARQKGYKYVVVGKNVGKSGLP